MDPKTLQTWLPLAIILLVFAFRYRNLSRPRPFKPGRLWIAPAIIVVLIGLMTFALPPGPNGWLVIAFGALIGAAIGWQRGKLMRLERDPDGSGLLIRQSPAALMLVLVILFAKRGLTAGLGIDPGAGDGAQPAPLAMLVTDGLLGFALGMVLASRLVLWQRAKSLLEGA